ncbi:MAG TPA: helix-turn-helix transcriptional regulator [Pseudonocardiaceae bacterium]|jgi:AraC-like DNA-binding protein|nr:helix-turn-helix transcriptional regulator [Pseudonocardiaceae bacterium]
MSRNGQTAVVVGDFHLVRGQWFGWHDHTEHQVVWAASGVANVRIRDGRTWVLPPSVALWLPAGLPHTTGASALTTMRSAYLRPDRCPLHLPEPTVIAVPALLRELITHLGHKDLPPDERRRAEAVVFDLVHPVSVTTIGVPEPTDERLRTIAAAFHADPADDRQLADWGRQVGASARNLARLFVADTGLTFGQWRTQLRLQAALPLLADGMAVNRVASRVGYATPSAFVAAFRRAVGVSPGAYFG